MRYPELNTGRVLPWSRQSFYRSQKVSITWIRFGRIQRAQRSWSPDWPTRRRSGSSSSGRQAQGRQHTAAACRTAALCRCRCATVARCSARSICSCPRASDKLEGHDLRLARWGARALARGLSYSTRMNRPRAREPAQGQRGAVAPRSHAADQAREGSRVIARVRRVDAPDCGADRPDRRDRAHLSQAHLLEARRALARGAGGAHGRHRLAA